MYNRNCVIIRRGGSVFRSTQKAYRNSSPVHSRSHRTVDPVVAGSSPVVLDAYNLVHYTFCAGVTVISCGCLAALNLYIPPGDVFEHRPGFFFPGKGVEHD